MDQKTWQGSPEKATDYLTDQWCLLGIDRNSNPNDLLEQGLGALKQSARSL